MVKLV